MNYLKDENFGCHSIIENMKLDKYMDLIEVAYRTSGGINGQRTALKTKSAKQIRERMADDFKNGAVLPPVVIGIVDDNATLSDETSPKEFKTYLNKINKENISIIDGMQRTTAMKEAKLTIFEQATKNIRVEFWIVNSINDLIYRMLVLNTGQVPWNTRRQLEVVFAPIKKIINERIPNLKLIEIDDEQRRTEAGEFQANKIIELFHVFSTRSEKFDTKQTLSESYQRIDMIESMSKNNIFDLFIKILSEIVTLDYIFSKCEREIEEGRFKNGRDLFTSQPILVGLTVILAQQIFGRAGINHPKERIEENSNKIILNFKNFNIKLNKKSKEEICSFLELNLLNELIEGLPKSSIGDRERSFFKDAFKVLMEENFELDNMAACWRA